MEYVNFTTSYISPEIVKQSKKDLLNNVIEGIHNEIFENAKQQYGLIDNVLLNINDQQHKELCRAFECALKKLERHLIEKALYTFTDDHK